MHLPDAFTIDERYDRVHASDRRSRFAVYLAQRADVFLDGDGEPTRDPSLFAISGLEIALPSVMSPPYVAPHRRILGARGHCDDDRRVAVEVDVAAPLPPTAQVFGWQWRSWVSDGASGRYFAPDDNGRPIALCQLTLRLPLDGRRLPEPRYRSDCSPHIDTAKDAVQLVVLQLNGALAELLAALATTRVA